MSHELDSLSVIPFSRAGSYLAISRLSTGNAEETALYFRTIRQIFQYSPMFRLELTKAGKAVAFTEEARPGVLTLSAGNDTARISFDGPDTLRFHSKSLGCRLVADHPEAGIGLLQDVADNICRAAWRGQHRADNCQLHLHAIHGKGGSRSVWDGMTSRHPVWEIVPDPERGCDFAFTESQQEPVHKKFRDFDSCLRETLQDYDVFRHPFPPAVKTDRRYAQAIYLTYSSIVHPSGLLRRRCLLVSKNKMSGMWSWDHCFNSIALAQFHPALALDQFLALFDEQSPQGGLPDLLTPTVAIRFHTKPPVHGFAFAEMRRLLPRFFKRRTVTEQVYPHLVRLTDFWFKYRTYGGKMPCYCHGKDSGWDNATVFLNPVPLSSPDLCSYLVLQLDLLREMAAELGRPDDAAKWKKQADLLLRRMIRMMWDGKQGFRVIAPDGSPLNQPGDCLISYIPAILGRRLPVDIFQVLREELMRSGRFLTPNGIASENPSSPLYEPAGYWRGPIWAPPNYLLAHGLDDGGAKEDARELARRYCKLCRNHGFPENFDALTGNGNDEKTLSWSSSIFMIFSLYLKRGSFYGSGVGS